MGPDKVTSRPTIMDRGRREMSRRRCRSVFFRYSAFDKALPYTRLYVTSSPVFVSAANAPMVIDNEMSLLRAAPLDTTYVQRRDRSDEIQIFRDEFNEFNNADIYADKRADKRARIHL